MVTLSKPNTCASRRVRWARAIGFIQGEPKADSDDFRGVEGIAMIKVGICGFGGLGHGHADSLSLLSDVEVTAV
jgi:hypothetical protein